MLTYDSIMTFASDWCAWQVLSSLGIVYAFFEGALQSEQNADFAPLSAHDSELIPDTEGGIVKPASLGTVITS